MTPKEAARKAAKLIGQTEMAAALKVSKATVSQWLSDSPKYGRPIPARHCPKIEALCNREVTCEQLHPQVDWAYVRSTPLVPPEREVA